MVSLPPATSHQPGSLILISCRREMSEGLPWGSASSGRRPAQAAITSADTILAWGK